MNADIMIVIGLSLGVPVLTFYNFNFHVVDL